MQFRYMNISYFSFLPSLLNNLNNLNLFIINKFNRLIYFETCFIKDNFYKFSIIYDTV